MYENIQDSNTITIYMICIFTHCSSGPKKLGDLVPYWRWCSHISSRDNRGGVVKEFSLVTNRGFQAPVTKYFG